MKNTFLIKGVISLIVIMTFGACNEDFIDLQPQNSGTIDLFYQNQTDFETAIAGVYSKFRSVNDVEFLFGEFRSDNLTAAKQVVYEWASNDIGPTSTSRFWALYTSLVHPANVILEKIDEVEMDSNIKNRIKGEALFFRGYAYYTLNLWFGGVPKVTSILSIDESLILGRSTEAEIWKLVQDDLSEAYSLLPPVVEIGRVDKYDAETYLAKAYMQEQKWGLAETALADVYTNSGALLETEFTDMWTMEAEKTSKEYMFSVLLSPESPINNFAQQYLFSDRDGGPGDNGEGLFQYEPGFYESFEDGDLRRDATVGYSSIQLTELNNKYIFGWDWDSRLFVGDLVFLRFADVQLLYADAISMNANAPQQKSLDLINETRNRAGLGDKSLTDVPNLNAFIELVLAERRSELALEGHRYADLKMHNKLVEKLNAIGHNFNETFNYVPIPQEEIDKTGGIITQNDGY